MESKVFEHDRVHLRADHGISELSPAEWRHRFVPGPAELGEGARRGARGGGLTRLYFGNVEQLDEPVYASTTSSRQLLATAEIQATDEPLYRAFFAEPEWTGSRRPRGRTSG
ncbi:hypothetical protein [Streptomyces scopuliridis]|uniref:hypothetical protein n=1 Tax=Streptomyces scopuliridis TaxID=452529 RepID=UPI0036925CC8